MESFHSCVFAATNLVLKGKKVSRFVNNWANPGLILFLKQQRVSNLDVRVEGTHADH